MCSVVHFIGKIKSSLSLPRLSQGEQVDERADPGATERGESVPAYNTSDFIMNSTIFDSLYANATIEDDDETPSFTGRVTQHLLIVIVGSLALALLLVVCVRALLLYRNPPSGKQINPYQPVQGMRNAEAPADINGPRQPVSEISTFQLADRAIDIFGPIAQQLAHQQPPNSQSVQGAAHT